MPKKKKLKTDADKAAEKAQHLRFGKAELTPDELSRLSKAQKREMYAAHAARSAVHREVDQYEDENVGVQALSEGEKTAGNVRDISKNRYARKLKKKAKMQGKKGARTAKSSAFGSDKAQSAEATSSEGNSNWFSRWWQKQALHRPQAAKRHPMAPLLQSPAWSRSSTKEDRWSAPQSTALPILQKATRTFF